MDVHLLLTYAQLLLSVCKGFACAGGCPHAVTASCTGSCCSRVCTLPCISHLQSTTALICNLFQRCIKASVRGMPFSLWSHACCHIACCGAQKWTLTHLTRHAEADCKPGAELLSTCDSQGVAMVRLCKRPQASARLAAVEHCQQAVQHGGYYLLSSRLQAAAVHSSLQIYQVSQALQCVSRVLKLHTHTHM